MHFLQRLSKICERENHPCTGSSRECLNTTRLQESRFWLVKNLHLTEFCSLAKPSCELCTIAKYYHSPPFGPLRCNANSYLLRDQSLQMGVRELGEGSNCTNWEMGQQLPNHPTRKIQWIKAIQKAKENLNTIKTPRLLNTSACFFSFSDQSPCRSPNHQTG